MRHIKRKIAQTILLVGISLFAFCSSALADIDWKRMKRDLSIQESILDQFFDEKKVSTTGLYIENHGVLLIASDGIQKYVTRVRAIGGASVNILQMKRGDKVWQIQKRGDKSSENEEEILVQKKPDASQNEKKAIKKQITEFLSIYGNAIGQLKDDDRVTIILLHSVVELNFHSSRSPSTESIHAGPIQSDSISMRIGMAVFKKVQESAGNRAFNIKITNPKGFFFHATVTKRDIEAHNRGKIDEQIFRDRITFREHDPQPSRDNRIDIMADILSNILKKNTDLRFLSDTKSMGFYQKGIGALFLVSQKGNLFGDWDKRDSDRDDGLDAFKTAVIETLADYGPTLRDLSPEESIIVHANLIGQSHFKIGHKDKTTDIKFPDRILFRVAKRDIEAYASQKIDLDTFRKRVAITEM